MSLRRRGNALLFKQLTSPLHMLPRTSSTLFQTSNSISNTTTSRSPTTRLQQFQKQFSTSPIKMSDSNKNFLLSEVFNVKGKVCLPFPPSSHTQLTSSDRPRNWRRQWNWPYGYSSPRSQRS